MTTSRTTPSEWMYKDGNAKVNADDIIQTARGWEKVHPNGQQELLHAFVTPGTASVLMDSVANMADATYDDTDVLTFTVTYPELVNVATAVPQLLVYTEEGTTVAIPNTAGTGTDTLTFAGALTGIADGQLVVIQEIDLNGATIQTAGAVDVNNNFPEDYVQPNITMLTP